MSNWAMEIEDTIFSIVEVRATENLISDYPNLFFTENNIINTDNVAFPTVYIHFLPSMEVGRDIDNTEINAISATAQIEVTVGGQINTLQHARTVASEILEQFKALRFNITEMPNFNGNTSDTKRMIFRASRVIGNADTF